MDFAVTITIHIVMFLCAAATLRAHSHTLYLAFITLSTALSNFTILTALGYKATT